MRSKFKGCKSLGWDCHINKRLNDEKMFFYIKCVLFVLVLSISGEISAQEKRDSVRIYFHQGKVNIDTCLLDNGNEMERFAKICSALNDSVRLIRKIQIIGGASPEGGGC